MGKRQHQSDKMYISQKEYASERGFSAYGAAAGLQLRRLPLFHCALSLQPSELLYADASGSTFDVLKLTEYVHRHKRHPVSGASLAKIEIYGAENSADTSFFKLVLDKDDCGQICDAVAAKPFSASSHVVAIRPSGRVYLYSTIKDLALKINRLEDPLTSVPFARKDIIVLQDPVHPERQDWTQYYHAKETARANNEKRLKLGQQQNESQQDDDSDAADQRSAYLSDNQAAAGFTSTASRVTTVNLGAKLDANQARYAKIATKALVVVKTNVGDLNVELFASKVPKTCENFVLLARRGYYNGSLFHRCIRHFMAQAGRPSAEAAKRLDVRSAEGESAWKLEFEDEFAPGLTHNKRGIVSMANCGPGTNASQFFITFGPCTHLDKKHTVFGQVVGGMDVLSKIEAADTDLKTNAPRTPLLIKDVVVLKNPFETEQASFKAATAEAIGSTATTTSTTSSSSSGSGSSLKGFQALRDLMKNKSSVGKPRPPPLSGPKPMGSSNFNFDNV